MKVKKLVKVNQEQTFTRAARHSSGMSLIVLAVVVTTPVLPAAKSAKIWAVANPI